MHDWPAIGPGVGRADRLIEELVATAEAVKASHLDVAETLERLAAQGGPPAGHRRAIAARARAAVELEDRHIARLWGKGN